MYVHGSYHNKHGIVDIHASTAVFAMHMSMRNYANIEILAVQVQEGCEKAWRLQSDTCAIVMQFLLLQ